ncbi:MAG: HAD family hydrolase [Nitrospina sp.]|jgi:putative hydrolase of the HAD superfamily|nr:HAD family hydrolase [Nitrospina sp.]MBT5632962.1 HAD family hydrolase [Nitrospina sp.]
MNFPFKAIGFDWAHTLVDLGEEDDRKPLEKIFSFLQAKHISLPDFEECLEKSRDLFKSMIELSRITHREARYEEVLKYLLFYFKIPWEGKASIEEILEVYYREVFQERKVFPEVESVLKQLSGVSMGIVSNTTNPVAIKEKELNDSGLKKYFDFAIYSSGFPFRKPHPSIFQLAIRHFQVPPSEIIFVGDSPTADILGAQSVGMKTAWLNRKKEKTNISPDYELSSLEDLLQIHCVNA